MLFLLILLVVDVVPVVCVLPCVVVVMSVCAVSIFVVGFCKVIAKVAAIDPHIRRAMEKINILYKLQNLKPKNQ
jgi:hypothetical protein